jgi:hypothetical protein
MRFIDLKVIVEQNVNVDGAVSIVFVDRLMCTPQLTLYLLGQSKHLAWQLVCFTENSSVQEAVLRLKAPGGCLKKRRLPDHLSYPLINEPDSLTQLLLPVSQI